eukprot:10653877-Prorocentrum_lima.AAC.1
MDAARAPARVQIDVLAARRGGAHGRRGNSRASSRSRGWRWRGGGLAGSRGRGKTRRAIAPRCAHPTTTRPAPTGTRL